MTVRELIEILEKANPRADVHMLMKRQSGEIDLSDIAKVDITTYKSMVELRNYGE